MKDIKYEIEEYPYNDLEMYRTDLSELAEIIGDMLKKNETNKPKKTKKEKKNKLDHLIDEIDIED
jgi:hypothetical protein